MELPPLTSSLPPLIHLGLSHSPVALSVAYTPVTPRFKCSVRTRSLNPDLDAQRCWRPAWPPLSPMPQSSLRAGSVGPLLTGPCSDHFSLMAGHRGSQGTSQPAGGAQALVTTQERIRGRDRKIQQSIVMLLKQKYILKKGAVVNPENEAP